jgi:polysaccharide biosynthesis/export protein
METKRIQYWAAVAIAALAIPLGAQRSAAQDNTKAKAPTQGSAGPESSAAAAKKVAEDPNYIIGAQDVLDINVWKEEQLTKMVPVRPDGKISLPLLNDVQAAGLTPIQLGAQITES